MAEWYYEQNNQQEGPIDAATFERLVRDKIIEPDTLVWTQGMAKWQALEELNPAAQDADTTKQDQVICAECGGLFDTHEAVEYAGQWVCAGCKSTYTQRMLETGATLATTHPGIPGVRAYAGFWIRVLAMFIDNIILNIPIFLVAMVAGVFLGASGADMDNPDSPANMVFMLVVYGISFLLPAIYFAGFHHKKGATPGKMAVGIVVVNDDGSRLSLGKAIGRYFAWILSAMICYIGFIIAGFEAEKRSLHDMICSTRVIYKSKG